MTLSLAQPSIAILIANGFDENHITAIQRTLTKAKLPYKMIAPEQGLVNGWQDNAWGHYFTVDCPLGTALGSDYDVLILVGGERGVAKLKTNPHTRRIVNHFLEARKPVAAIGASVSLLAMSPKSAGLTVSASQDVLADAKEARMELSADACSQDGVLLTSNGADVEAWAEAVLTLVSSYEKIEEEVAA